ncbi:MAG: hypothetical protein DIZ80_16115 [endosymbiont of Galathealinum brachiosum]|uniref:DUF7939 domain-containing protein n=1 Tax=endosymbiont of Galathealinum brachiosum TaxID=2200906 RepID=A0A370DBP1_9GAMM|nr:MAG: hypothetical protein DIZ80_16115 [endosymbiont of Galathealinum brachiosum]
MKLFIKAFFLLLLLISFNAHAVDINVKADRTQIEINETFTLIFEADGDTDDEPDFSPLEKDFQILGTSTGSNISIINGEYKRSKKWNISLVARRKGNITIPQIYFGNDVSPSYQISIKEPQKSTGKPGETLISELIISSDTVYPQAQLIVTQRLLSSSNLAGYEFAPLKISGVENTKETLGEVNQYQTKLGNTPYLVLEQRYAIYPQSAGKLVINPSIATVRVAIQNSRGNRSTFDPFRSNTKTIRRSSDKKIITVKSIPDSFKGKHWLAAKEVQLVEEFPEATSFKAGEPITRTLLLIADGQNASQLPEFSITNIKGLKQYPDKPLLKNNLSEDSITGIQQIKVALIPSSSGSYTLPAISIPWWNTQTDKLEIASIKARTFTVDSASFSETTDIKPDQPEPARITSLPEKEADIRTGMPANVTNPADKSLPWIITSLLLATALLFTLFLLWKSKRRNSSQVKNTQTDNTSLKQALTKLEQSCNESDAKASKDALLLWGKSLFENESVHSIADLSGKVDNELTIHINALNSYLYRDNSDQWKCNELFNLCVKFTENYKSKQSTTGHEDKLESLYK